MGQESLISPAKIDLSSHGCSVMYFVSLVSIFFEIRKLVNITLILFLYSKLVYQAIYVLWCYIIITIISFNKFLVEYLFLLAQIVHLWNIASLHKIKGKKMHIIFEYKVKARCGGTHL